MLPYKNEASPIMGYATSKTGIVVSFKNGAVYSYSILQLGASVIKRMKEAAERGNGLATIINKYVRSSYHQKFANKWKKYFT